MLCPQRWGPFGLLLPPHVLEVYFTVTEWLEQLLAIAHNRNPRLPPVE
jgi:hypothetical protein